MISVCNRCGSEQFEEREQGPHVGLFCTKCSAWIKWIPQQMTEEKADCFIMPFGKHKGTTLGRIRMLDREYIVWIVKKFPEKDLIHRAAKALL